jgi:general secretion pathway protein B
MSILLDSLRKSEAQRRIGDAPSIHSTQEYGSRTAASKQWLAVVMIILTAFAIAWCGWKQFAVPGAGSDEMQAEATEISPSGADAGQGNLKPEPAEAPAQDSGNAARTPVEALSASSQSAADASSDSVQSPVDSADSPAMKIAGFVAADEDNAGPDERGELAISMDAENPAEEPEELVIDPDEDFTEVVEAAPRNRTRVQPPESEPLTYWQLPESIREGMPEFRINVLVYADSPEDRFILINGERLREQEELEGGVVLQEIRRDGAVFSYRQYRFLVKS